MQRSAQLLTSSPEPGMFKKDLCKVEAVVLNLKKR